MANYQELKTQIDRLVVVVRSIGIKNALTEANANPHLVFWRLIYGSMLDIAVIEWCKVFGTDDQPTHWKNFISDHAAFRKKLFSFLDITQDQWSQYWQHMTNYRNTHAAHHLGVKEGDTYPVLDIALKSCLFYYSKLIEKVKALGVNNLPESLEAYSKQFNKQTFKIAKAALASTNDIKEEVF
jgi:hypothetical protein